MVIALVVVGSGATVSICSAVVFLRYVYRVAVDVQGNEEDRAGDHRDVRAQLRVLHQVNEIYQPIITALLSQPLII